jgi:hypothetical protein
VKELEARLATLERDLAAARSDSEAALKEAQSDAEEARATARRSADELAKKDKQIADLQNDVEKARNQAAQKTQASQLAVLKQKDERIEELESRVAELEEAAAAASGKASGESAARIAQLEKELEEARANVPRVAEELAREKKTYHEKLLAKEQEIEALNVQLQAGSGAAASAGGGAALAEKEAALQKALTRAAGLEKLVQDGERLYLKLQREMDQLKETSQAGDAAQIQEASEKELEIGKLREETGRQKGIIDELQKRLQDQEEELARRASAEAKEASTRPGGLDVGEAKRMIQEVGAGLSGLSEQLKALSGRVRDFEQGLEAPAEPEPAAEAAAEPPRSDGAEEAAAASGEPVEPPPVEESGAEVLADAASEPSDPGIPAVQETVPTVEEAVAIQQAKVQAEQGEEELEMLPEPQGEGLPQDETLLDMGKMGKALRAPAPAPSPAAAPPPPVRRPDTRIRPKPPAPEEKKGGFFGKLFGKKK